MAENTTIARPYARAVFEVARDQGRFAEWSAMLQALEQVVAIPEVADLAGDPRLTPEQLAGVVAEAAGKALDSQGTNFVQLLAEKDRLTLVPEIHTLFEELRAASENRVDVELRSPSEVADAQKQRIAEALKRRFGREVELHCVKDESLLGGAVIRAGDTIIDASVRGKLERLASEMSL